MIFRKMVLYLAVIFLFVSCSIEEWDRHYQKLDGDMIRPFSYQFKNPEIAPGDTVELDVFFGGKKVNLDNLSFRVCWNYYTDRYGNAAPRGEESLKLVSFPQIVEDNEHCRILRIKFLVPDSVLYKSDAVPSSLNEMAAMYGLSIPDLQFPTSKVDILQMFENLAENQNLQKSFTFEQGAVINGLAQVLSAMFEIYIVFPESIGAKRAKIRHTVRYHGKLSDVKGVYTNKNPEIEEIKIWAMNEKDAYSFDSLKSELIPLSGDTVNISLNKNKTIYMGIKASQKDSTLTLEQAFSVMHTVSLEQYSTRHFFEGDTTYYKLMFRNEEPFGGSADGYNVRKIVIDDELRGKAKLGDIGYVFIVLEDDKIGVVYHPQGRCTKGFPVRFTE